MRLFAPPLVQPHPPPRLHQRSFSRRVRSFKSETERRKIRVRTFYEFEIECWRQGWGDPALLYDEEHDLLRFTDGKFAFSGEHADWELLRKRGRLKNP